VDEHDGRRLAQDLALTVQAALLRRHAPDFVFEAFAASRLGAAPGLTYGGLPPSTDFERLLQRAAPV
jgi:putative acyl-CoA dehydrogenase